MSTPRSRKPRPLRPFDPRKGTIVLEGLRAGKGLDTIARSAGVSEYTIHCWLAHAQRRSGGPELEPYKAFAAAFREAVLDREPVV